MMKDDEDDDEPPSRCNMLELNPTQRPVNAAAASDNPGSQEHLQ